MKIFNNLFLMLLFLSNCLVGQAPKEKDNQWWVGLKTGFNTTNVLTDQAYSVFSYVDGDKTPEEL